MELLAKIPKEATTATVQGIKMQMIDKDTWKKMLWSGTEQQYSDCIMANGVFIISKQDGQLQSLYKVKDSPTEEMFRIFSDR